MLLFWDYYKKASEPEAEEPVNKKPRRSRKPIAEPKQEEIDEVAEAEEEIEEVEESEPEEEEE